MLFSSELSQISHWVIFEIKVLKIIMPLGVKKPETKIPNFRNHYAPKQHTKIFGLR